MIGNLTRDPEYKQLPSGQGVCRLGLASNRQYKNRQTGEMVQEVCFVDIDVFGAQAESCNQYLQKGRPVLVEGRLKFDTWQTAEGQNRNKHSIVADRVVFLSASPTDQESVSKQDSHVSPAEIDKELMSKIEAATKKKAKKTEKKPEPSAEATDTGEIAFKDEPPFQDDLPF